jgi:hypothetical protein
MAVGAFLLVSRGQYSASVFPKEKVLGQVSYEGFSWDLLGLAHMREFGNLGLYPCAVSSCGWSHMTDTGRRISWQGRGYHTQRGALSMIKWRKPSIFSYLVSSLGSFGSLLQHVSIHQLSPQLTDCGGKDQAMLLLG